MIIIDYVKRTVRNNTNIRSWMGWGSIKSNGKVIGDLVKEVGNINDGQATADSFEAMVKRLGLTEKDIKKRATGHLIVSIFCLLLFLGAFGWAIHLVVLGMLMSAAVSLSLSVLMLAYAFRENFIYFQLKQRSLTVTVQDWIKSITPGRGK